MEVRDYIALADNLRTERAAFEGGWDEMRRIIMPRATGNAYPDSVPDNGGGLEYSDVANTSLKKLASAHLTYITPLDRRWFTLRPVGYKKDGNQTLNDWYSKATEVKERELAISNFYSVMHEVYLDRCLTGTGCMFSEMNLNKQLIFRHIPTGTYAIAESESGDVDTLVRWFRLTAHQAAQKWGEEALGPKVRRALRDAKRRYTDSFEFVQCVLPNPKGRLLSNNLPAKKRPWQDMIISLDDKKIVFESGFYEFPFLVTRFLRWGDSPYGIGAAWHARRTIRMAIDMEKILYTLGQVKAYPRLFLLASQYGDVDLRAGGQTTITAEAAGLNMPREWGTQGQYDIGLEYLRGLYAKIEEAFYVPMLETVSRIDRQMTATEVAAREAEKVLGFTPSFTLFVSDFRMMCQRIMALLYRAGKLPDPVPGVFETNRRGAPTRLAVPQVLFMGKIAQAIARTQTDGLMTALESIGTLSQMTGRPELLDIVNLNKAGELIYDSKGAPMECKATEDEMKSKEVERKQQQEAALQTTLAEQSSVANKNNAQAQQALQAS
ncbi:portal protein [Akkermansia massiliensis]|uniref:portal protein n=1 Tax=Akkermansia massiliensis TaxID=2927224 RepID=UPI002030F795|nr:portal protein [Akkermansia sp. B2-R-115]MCM0686169.1 portal protein [Akkermansia sp. B2-R-115]